MAVLAEHALSIAAGLIRDSYKDKRWHMQVRPRDGFLEHVKFAEEMGLQFVGSDLKFNVLTKVYSGTTFDGGSETSKLAPPKATAGSEAKINYTDLKRVTAGIQYTLDAKLEAAGIGAVVDWVLNTREQVNQDWREAQMRKFWQDGNARMGTIDGLGTLTDAGHSSGGTVITSSTSIQFPIKNGSISHFRPGMSLAFYNGATYIGGGTGATHNGEIHVLDIFRGPDTEDYTGTSQTGEGWIVRVKIEDKQSGGGAPTTSNALAASGNDIYLGHENGTNEKGNGLFGPLAWFDSSGTPTIFNINRTTIGNDFWMPTVFREGATTDATFEIASHFSPNFPVIRRKRGTRNDNLIWVAAPELTQKMTDDMAAAGNFPIPPDQSGMKELTANFGFDGLIFHSPHMGAFGVKSDDYAPTNKVFILDPSTWFTAHVGPMGFLPGAIGGIWWQVMDASDSYARYRAHMYGRRQFGCTYPGGNFLIDRVTAGYD